MFLTELLLDGHKPTLVILGAGSSRILGPHRSVIKPPLDTDFFRMLQWSKRVADSYKEDLLWIVRSQYGADLDVRMETVFTDLVAQDDLLREIISRPRKKKRSGEFQIGMRALTHVLPQLFGETINHSQATPHRQIAMALETDDVVISMNYDCAFDWALVQASAYGFEPENGGYGLKVVDGSEHWSSSNEANRAVPLTGDGANTGERPSMRLYKLHGSMNWKLEPEGAVSLRKDPYAAPFELNAVLPPVSNKPITNSPFKEVWRAAADALTDVKRVIVVGYSLPPADIMFRTLLRTSLSPGLEDVVIVDPSAEVQKHLTAFFGSISRTARVHLVDGFVEFMNDVTNSMTTRLAELRAGM